MVFPCEIRSSTLASTLKEAISFYRIDLVWRDFFGPNDHVTIWYGRQGMLGLEFHLENEAIDAEGNPIGVLISEEKQTLTALHIANSSRFSGTP